MPRDPILFTGDVLDILPLFDAEYFDACLCDPPYLLEFMGKEFDRQHKLELGANDGQRMHAWHLKWCNEIYRVLKPGGFVLAFGGTRTVHRLACALEDAGFEIRDQIDWMYGSGFPKSHDISKGIDKLNGDEREVIGSRKVPGFARSNVKHGAQNRNKYEFEKHSEIPASNQSALWSGYGTALKPAHEPIILAMKPLEGTFAQNALEYGVAGLNIDECRVGLSGGKTIHTRSDGAKRDRWEGNTSTGDITYNGGRWPANLILSHHLTCNDTDCHPLCPVRLLDEQSGQPSGCYPKKRAAIGFTKNEGRRNSGTQAESSIATDAGGASRFFYCAKVSTRERNLGGIDCRHPTLKPIDLSRYLSTLLMPPPRDNQPRRIVIPFSGAGSEVAGSLSAGWEEAYGIERDSEYMEWAKSRIAAHLSDQSTQNISRARRKREPVASTDTEINTDMLDADLFS